MGGGKPVPMPSFQHILSSTDIANASAYVAQDLADPASHAASVSQGGVVYRLYCGGCHSASGRGGAIVNGVNAPSLLTMPPANALAAMVPGTQQHARVHRHAGCDPADLRSALHRGGAARSAAAPAGCRWGLWGR